MSTTSDNDHPQDEHGKDAISNYDDAFLEEILADPTGRERAFKLLGLSDGEDRTPSGNKTVRNIPFVGRIGHQCHLCNHFGGHSHQCTSAVYHRLGYSWLNPQKCTRLELSSSTGEH